MKKIIITSTLLVASIASSRFTSGDRRRATEQGNRQAAHISSSAQLGQGTTTATNSLEQNSQQTMKNSQKGQAVAQVMQIGFNVAGGVYAAQCGSQNYAACVKAAILFGMGMMSGRSKNSFNGPINTAWDNACNYSSLGCNGQTPENPYVAELTPAVINEAENQNNIQQINDALSKGGYAVDVNSGKIKTPKGEIGMEPESLKNALGSEGYSALMGQVKDIEKDAKAKVEQVKASAITAALGFDGGGGGIGSGQDGYDVDASNTGGGSFANKLDKFRKPAQARGLTKNFNGDPIGIAADSIFEMMNRRYQLKNSQKTFYSGPEAN